MVASIAKDLGGKESLLLQQMIKSGAVESIGLQGPERGSQEDRAMFQMYDEIKRRTGFDRLTSEDISEGRTTRMVFAQIASLSEQITSQAEREDIALCISFRAEQDSSDGSAGQISAIIVFTKDSLKYLYPLIVSKPETAFALIRIANNGPIKLPDSSVPATILPGDKVRIMPNVGVGGKLDKIVESQPFPSNFDPNPLF